MEDWWAKEQITDPIVTGNIDPANHASTEITYVDITWYTHVYKHDCCDLEEAPEAHTFVDGKCDCGAYEHICAPYDYQYVDENYHSLVCECWEALEENLEHELTEYGYCVCGAFYFEVDFNGGRYVEDETLTGIACYTINRENFPVNDEEYIELLNEMFTKEGCRLVGLAYDAAGTQPYNGETISRTTTLYLTWEPLHTCAHDRYGSDEKGHWSVCSCGEALTESEEHSWSEWQETKPATGTSEGEETRICTVCELEEKRSIDKLGNGFVDVLPGAYYEVPVQWAVEKGITNGVDDTHFAPGAACTRAQIVTFLWRAAGSPEPPSAANPFADVLEGSFYYKAVLWAVEKGIATGTDATHFAPNAPCTRGQVVTFLWRFQGKPASGGSNIFTDVAPGAYYYDAVLWAVEKGITNGMGDGTFGTGSPCSRGQIVTFLYRTLG